MIVRALVAICDGVIGGDGVGLAPGSIYAQHDLPIPVVLDFDSSRVVGTATLELLGNNLHARMELSPDTPIAGRFPAIGIHGLARLGPIYTRVAVLAISLGVNRNADPRVPPLDLGASGGPIVV